MSELIALGISLRSQVKDKFKKIFFLFCVTVPEAISLKEYLIILFVI